VIRSAGIALFAVLVAASPATAQSGTCAREAASIKRAESQLPRLDVAPSGDKQIVCITLETNILFARRLAAHLSHCPRSPLAQKRDDWRRAGAQYAAQFSDKHCKLAIRGFRG
jgi:hypothetical protein